jgi:hypothetical protein
MRIPTFWRRRSRSGGDTPTGSSAQPYSPVSTVTPFSFHESYPDGWDLPTGSDETAETGHRHHHHHHYDPHGTADMDDGF